jgi:hypothetical protein
MSGRALPRQIVPSKRQGRRIPKPNSLPKARNGDFISLVGSSCYDSGTPYMIRCGSIGFCHYNFLVQGTSFNKDPSIRRSHDNTATQSHADAFVV